MDQRPKPPDTSTLFRCIGEPFKNSRGYCWRNSDDKAHAALNSKDLTSLVQLGRNGHGLQLLEDVSEDIRQKRDDRPKQEKSKRRRVSDGDCRPVTTNNVMLTTAAKPGTDCISSLGKGELDAEVSKYRTWQRLVFAVRS